MIPSNITKDHIITALEEIDKNGIPKDRSSAAYDLVADGKSYPPKYVISIANKYANGKELSPQDFQGGAGTDTHRILQDFGFELVAKNDPRATLVEQYKKRVTENQLVNEVYKWQLIEQFKGRPNLKASDFHQEIKDLQFANLIYAMAFAVLKHIAKDKPEELRELFTALFDESKDVKSRIQSFNENSLKLYRSLGETLQHHQDERSIACYLTYFNPEKYTFYKSSFYKKYCKLLGIKEAPKNEKYIHYLQLIDQLVDEYILPDTELKSLVQNAIPEFYDENNLKLIAQDMLYQMLDQEEETNYWIFQGNPKIFDFETALRENVLNDWTVSAHKDKIKVGDKVILWITGNQAGCYAFAEITREPHTKAAAPDDHLWKEEDKSTLKAGIKITHNLFDAPILKADLDNLPEFKNLNVGNQGTNFSATKEEYEALLGLIDTGLSFEAIKKKFESAIFENFISTIRQINQALGIDKNDERIVYSLRRNRLSYTVGQRYGLNIYTNDNKGIYRAMSVQPICEKYEAYDGKAPQPFYNYTNNFNDLSGNIQSIIDAIGGELKRTKKSGYRKHNNFEFENFVFEQKNKTMTPINKILYGPPGTGKTFKLKSDYFPKYTTKEDSLSREQYFDSLVRDLTWWQVITLALIESGTSRVNDLFNNRWVAKKASFSESKNVRATLWGTLQMHTIQSSQTVSYTQRQAPLIFDKLEDKTWQLIESEARENCPDLYELLDEVNNFNPNPDKEIKCYVFATFHQAFGYEDFIEGIKPIMSDDETVNDLAYRIEDGIFKQICSRAETDPENRYAIFIDEINRGNVSAIFGELITLIENDKRIGMTNGFKVKLPYSKKEFGVPANLDIIGTMNTADRSVESLDTALRRRFVFEEMMPKPEKLQESGENKSGKIQGIDLRQLLEIMNQRIEVLVDRDHTIGHAFFIGNENIDDLRSTFANKIIPLLQEYFYGDYGKMMMVIGQDFFHPQLDASQVVFAVNHSEYRPEGKVLNLKNIADKEHFSDEQLIAALKKMINPKEFGAE
jgi:hypothetical protein